MPSFAEYNICPATHDVPSDVELESLLRRVYVGEGFISEELAIESLAAKAVRNRGELLVAVKDDERKVVGTVILVTPGSPSQRLAGSDREAEVHLLAVLPEFRRHGVGRKLIAKALERARAQGFESVVLWTQASMLAAHRLYMALGFTRFPERDFQNHRREFLVMRAEL